MDVPEVYMTVTAEFSFGCSSKNLILILYLCVPTSDSVGYVLFCTLPCHLFLLRDLQTNRLKIRLCGYKRHAPFLSLSFYYFEQH